MMAAPPPMSRRSFFFLHFGHFDPAYARNRIIAKALGRAGASVTTVTDPRSFARRTPAFCKTFPANLSHEAPLNATLAGCRDPPASSRGQEGYMTQTHASGATVTANSAGATAGHGNKHLPALVLGAFGVVYGDIGTSPIYAFRQAFADRGTPGDLTQDVLGLLSLIVCSSVLLMRLTWMMLGLKLSGTQLGYTGMIGSATAAMLIAVTCSGR